MSFWHCELRIYGIAAVINPSVGTGDVIYIKPLSILISIELYHRYSILPILLPDVPMLRY